MNLKNISIFWIVLLFYPILYFMSAYGELFGDTAFSSFICLAIAQLTAFIGMGISSVLYRLQIRHQWQITLFQIISAIIPFYIINLFAGDKYNSFLFVDLIILFIGLRSYVFSFDKIVHGSFYIFSLVEYFIVSLLFKYLIPDKFHLIFLYITLMISSFIFMFLKNRTNIKSLMKNRNYNEKYLSEYTKKYNNRFVSFLCVIFSASLLLRKPVSFIYRISGKTLKKTLKAVISFLQNLSPEILDDEQPPEKEPMEPPLLSPQDKIPVLRYILGAIIIIIVITFLIKYHDIISDLIQKAYLYIRKKLRKTFTHKPFVDSSGYTDYEEDVSTVKNRKKGFTISQKKLWKKNLIKYNSMNQSKEKFRFGYGLILSWLNISEKNKKASETVNETAARINNNSFTKLTEAYNPIRYGEYECNDQNISQLENTLNNLHNTIN